MLQGYKNTAGIGYHLNFEDPLSSRSLGITAAYTPDEKPAGQRARPRRHRPADYLGSGARELSWNRSDFYDLFGPTERSRKGYAAKLGYD